MTLSVVTGAYHDLLSLDEVIDKELILFVSLNTNKNSKAVTALGGCCCRTALMIGKRYENEQERRREKPPDGQRPSRRVCAICLFELAHILQRTAAAPTRGSWFALQALPPAL